MANSKNSHSGIMGANPENVTLSPKNPLPATVDGLRIGRVNPAASTSNDEGAVELGVGRALPDKLGVVGHAHLCFRDNGGAPKCTKQQG